jgi:hypothetical protein
MKEIKELLDKMRFRGRAMAAGTPAARNCGLFSVTDRPADRIPAHG